MQKFHTHKGIAAPLDIMNVDTDMLIPKQFLKTIKRTGLGCIYLMRCAMRKTAMRVADFILNQPPYRQASILVTGDNFGCGSSREHAPWALLDFGVRVVISTSFADIFYNNCFKNGILPITISASDREALMADARDSENPELEVDLPNQVIRRPNGASIAFDIDPFRKQCLLDGVDDIGLTLEKSEAIDAFAKKRRTTHPWL